MTSIDFRGKVINWRAQAVLCLLLLAIVLRASIPIGYMPHTGALRDGRIEITFCTTAGNEANVPSTLAGLFADDNEHNNNALSGTDCPFGILIHQALGIPGPSAIAMPLSAARSIPAVFFDNQALPALGAQGPPVGSRAPPFFLS